MVKVGLGRLLCCLLAWVVVADTSQSSGTNILKQEQPPAQMPKTCAATLWEEQRSYKSAWLGDAPLANITVRGCQRLRDAKKGK